MNVKYVYPSRKKAAAKQRRTWRHILSLYKRNIGIPAIRRIKV